MKRVLCSVLLACLAATSGHARLGETLDQLKTRFGSPEPQTRKESYVWTFEAPEEGLLIYTVTFDAKGLSIAEGLKPFKRAAFSNTVARNFVEMQLENYKDSKTARVVKAGEKYTYGGKAFVCGEHEYVVVDEANKILIVWTQDGIPSVIVVRPEMV